MEVKKWLDVLLPYFEQYFYGNGGPVILLQIENDYAKTEAKNNTYMVFLRDVISNLFSSIYFLSNKNKSNKSQLLEKYTQDKAVLYTVDTSNSMSMPSARMKDVLITTKFGANQHSSKVNFFWIVLRQAQKYGPLVNSELNTGEINSLLKNS